VDEIVAIGSYPWLGGNRGELGRYRGEREKERDVKERER
jgi:hypothetical protein